MSILHRVEGFGDNHIQGEFVTLSFETEYYGIWQCQWVAKGMSQYDTEPAFEMLKEEEQKQIKEIGPFVFYLTHGMLPKHLNS